MTMKGTTMTKARAAVSPPPPFAALLGVLCAALALPGWAGVVGDPRVLLDATLTVGTYDEGVAVHATTDHWGYIDAGATGFAAAAAGTLAGAAFTYEGTEYTVKRLAVKGSAGSADSVVLDIEDGAGRDLASDARVGIEVRSGSGATVMIPWNLWNGGGALQGRLRNAAKNAIGDWRQSAAGTTLPVRLLDLGVQDVMSGHLEAGGEISKKEAGNIGSFFAGSGTINVNFDSLTGDGAVRPVTSFPFQGVDYTVETLGIVSGINPGSSYHQLALGTAPVLATDVGLRLATPLYAPDRIEYDGLFRYREFDASSHGGGADYSWPWDPASRPNDLENRKLPLYLTTLPGESRLWDEVWSATVTPEQVEEIVAYRRAGVTIPGRATAETSGAGGIRRGAETFVLDGTSYTVNAVGFETTSNTGTMFPHFWFHSTPALPRGGALALLVERDDETRYYRIADAAVENRGYVWRWYDAADNSHGWTSGDEKADSTLNDRTVRLLQPGGSLDLLRVAVSPDGTSITLTYNGALDEDSAPAAADFEVLVDGAAVAVARVTVAGSTVTLELETPVFRRQAVTVAYTGTALRHAGGVPAATFAARAAETGPAPLGPTLANPHPRVLLDTALTIGTYRGGGSETDAYIDHYGYADGSANFSFVLEAGALERTTFLHDAVEYTIHRLTFSTDGGGTFGNPNFLIKTNIGGTPSNLPATAPLGIEFGTPTGGVAIDLRRLDDDDDALAAVLEDVWVNGIGRTTGLRALHLGTPDLWNADLGYGAKQDSGGRKYVGYGAPAAGTLSSTTFDLDGVSYTVDRLTVSTATDSERLQFSTTPDLPAGVAVAVPYDAGSDAASGVALHYRIDPAYEKAGDAAVDYEWDWRGLERADLAGHTVQVYLTRVPGGTARAEGAKSLAAFEVTPGKSSHLLAYRRANVPLGSLPLSVAGLGTLDPAAGAVTVDGTAYTINAVGFVSADDPDKPDDRPIFMLNTAPALPLGQGLGVAVARADGTYAYWIDQADDSESYGYRWVPPDGVTNEHGWDMTAGGAYRTWPVHIVRLAPRESAVVTLSLSLDTLAEGAGAVDVEVTAELDALPRSAPTVVTVTAGAPGDTAEAADYEAAPLALTIPAGARRATGTLTLTAVDDAETEDAEFFTVTGATPELAVVGAAVTVPGNDYGVYLNSTLTARANPIFSGTVGFRVSATSNYGSLSVTRFGCCVGISEVEYNVTALGSTGGPTFWHSDPAMAEAAPQRRGLVLSIGDARLPLDDFSSIFSSGLTSWDAAKLAELGATVSLVDGGTYPVRILGPWHPQVSVLLATSNPPSSVATGGGTAKIYAPGDVVRFRVDYDEPVAVTGAPTLAFGVRHDGTTTEAEAAYLPAESSPTALAFGYTVAATEPLSGALVLLDDTDGTADGVQSPLDGGVIDAVLARSTSTASRFMPPEMALGNSLDDTGQLLQTTGSPTTSTVVGVVSPGRVPEGAGTLAFPVRLSRAPAAEVTVEYALTGTATAGADYAGTASGTLTIAAGAISASVSLALTDDALDEPDKTVIVTLSNPSSGLELDADATVAQAVIVDDDLPKVSIAAPELARNTGYVFEDETTADASPGLWSLTRAGVIDEALTVTLRASESGGDFVAFADDVDQTLTFSANTSMTSYTPVTSDMIDEVHGTVTVTLRAGAGYDIEGPAAATANVRDDDGMPLLAVTVDPAALSVREGLPAQFHAVGMTVTDGTFTMPADIGRLFGGTGVTVNAASADGTGALAGTDYTALASGASAILLFADAVPIAGGNGLGLRAALPAIATADDGAGDAGETFTVTVSLPSGLDASIVTGSPTVATATLVEGPVVTLVLDDDDLDEGETAMVTATADPVHDAPFTVTVATDPVSSDRFEFTDSNRVLSFAASSANSTGTVRIRAVANDIDDGDVEGIVLSGAPSVAAVAAPAALTFAVRDDDLPKVSIAAPELARNTGHVFEAEVADATTTGGPWVLTRAGLTEAALAVTVAVSESGGDFVASATETADQTVTFLATEDTANYTPVTADTTDEAHGTVTVTLQAGAGYDIDGPPAAAAAVRDDDGTLLTVTVDPAALSVPEGQPARFHAAGATPTDGTFTVLGDLARVFGGTGVTVNAASADGTAMQPGDYTALATGASVTLTFADATPAGGGTGFGLRAALPAVDTVDDGTGDAGETFTVTLSLPTGQMDMRIVLGAQKVGTATLVEGPSVTLVLNDDDLAEGETATVTATVDPVHTLAFTVTVATDPVSSERFEFVGSNRILSFAVGGANSTGLVEIRAVDNDVDDGDVEKGAADGFSVTGTADDVNVTGPEAVPFAVRDDDLPKVSIAAPELARNTGHVFEAEVADLTATGGPWVLTRAGLTEAALAVTVAVSESGGDFVASATETADQTVTFAATADTANYTPVTADTTDEVHGTVTVTLKTTGADYDIEGAAAASADVRDDDGAGTLLVLGAAPATLTVAEGNAAQVSVAAKTVADGTFTQTGDLGRVFAGATSATVDASTGGGTATAGTDYTALASGTTVTVRFADLTVSGRGLRLATPAALPPVQTTDDETVDDNETFVVTLAKAAGTDARIGLDPATATVTIVEGPPNGSLRICGADGMCVTGAGVSCPATDLVCVSGMSAAVPAEGRLEVAWDGKFGTVCDDYWTTTDADVACRDIGHAAGQRSFVRSHFGGAQRGVKIWFDDVKCLGSEATLAACPRSGGTGSAGSNNCSVRHTEDAGVRCLAAATALPTVEARPMNLTVAPGDTARYWLSLTKRPDDEDFWAAPRAPAGGAVTVSPERVWMTNDERGWSFAQWVDVTASAVARVGDSHTIVHETTAHAYRDGTVPAVPDVTVTVAAPSPSGSGGPRPAGAWASDRR